VGVFIVGCYAAAMMKQAEVVIFPTSVGPDESYAREALDAQRLQQVLARIRTDARLQGRQYQDDTVVPEGGE
jgi:hypothetical protein